MLYFFVRNFDQSNQSVGFFRVYVHSLSSRDGSGTCPALFFGWSVNHDRRQSSQLLFPLLSVGLGVVEIIVGSER
jgi:hypothetical protein